MWIQKEKNAWYNSRTFLSSSINAAIFITLTAVFGWSSGLVIKLGKKKISESKNIFSVKS
ncbi:hypothetical protein KSI01_32440 [Kurthia sibirica]|uniref:Uncharacterized protein n=1 Tax=Kurthia sibirica TaxID=202750 RepID=A0A2U3AIU2_9BACL|nr:hypothetical protein DEX24_13480 [Kurthia sibirica]GEK35711.1 hypothetical protein KSI01_32440 [Kurthia sibirica]